MKHNVKQTFKLDLILVCIPSSLILSVKNRGVGGGLLNRQKLLSMIKVRLLDLANSTRMAVLLGIEVKVV